MSTPNNNRSTTTIARGLSCFEVLTWGGLGFLIGMTVGGLLVSFFMHIILAILGAAINEDLTLKSEGQLLRLAFVVIGMVIVGALGFLISLSNRNQARETNALAEQRATQSAAQTLENNAQSSMEKSTQSSSAGLTVNILDSFRYTGFLFSDTIRLLLPSPVISTQRYDKTYISDMSATFKDMMLRVNVSESEREIILKNWLPQIEWTNTRANRERDANEMMSWWQIILTALIPFIATADSIFGLKSTNVVAILGIFVTILTALIRFRRPEERWKHYRRLTEDYQRELWNFVSLSGPYKDEKKDHKSYFKEFNEKMTLMRENDIRVFLGEVMNNTPAQVPNQTGSVSQVAVIPPGANPIIPDNG